METIQATATPRAWVGCLGCYNSGALVGEWLEGEDCGDLVAAGLARVETHGDYTAPRCVKCGGDEFWVFDHEGFGGFIEGECSPSEAQAVAVAFAAIEGEGLNVEAVTGYAKNMGLDLSSFDEWRADFESAYQGEWDSVEDFAREFIDSTGLLQGVPEHIARYFDYERYAQDLEYDLWTWGDHIFWSN